MIPSSRRRAIRQRTQELRLAISALDYLAGGTLLARTKTCGKANCRCASDPDARHGPYFEWSRMKDGRLVHSTVSKQQADLLERAIANFREVQDLLKTWHDETETDILGRGPDLGP